MLTIEKDDTSMGCASKFKYLTKSIYAEDPTRAWSAWWQTVPEGYKWAFLVGIVVGFLAHGFGMFNLIVNEDVTHYLYTPQVSGWRIGRWASSIHSFTREGYIAPAFVFGLSIIALSLAGCITASLWKSKNTWTVALIAGLFVSFPAFAAALSFQYETYAFGTLFAVLSVYYTLNKGWIGVILGAIFLMLSAAENQVFICVSASLSLLTLFIIFLDRQEAGKDRSHSSLITKIIQFISMGLLGGVLYMVSVKLVILMHPGETLSTYKGAEEMGSIAFSEMPYRFKLTYIYFHDFLLSQRYGTMTPFAEFLMTALFILTGITCLFLAIRSGKGLTGIIISILMTVMTIMLLPVTTFVVLFMMPPGVTGLYILQMFGIIAGLAFCFYILIDRQFGIFKTIALALCMLLTMSYVARCNAVHLKGYLLTQSAFLTANRVLSRVEELPEFSPQCKVAFVGKLPNSNYPAINRKPFIDVGAGFKAGVTAFAANKEREDDHWDSYSVNLLYRFMGIELQPATNADWTTAWDAASNMPEWPKKGSVAAIRNDLIVVNLGVGLGDINIKKVSTRDYQFTLTVPNTMTDKGWQCAWYIYRIDGKTKTKVDSIWYKPANSLNYHFKEPGNYTIKGFIQTTTMPQIKYSHESINFEVK